jgi:ABC-type sulfate transport system permease component
VCYSLAFVVMYEMSQLFWDLRGPVHRIWHAASVGPFHEAIRVAIAISLVAAAMALCAIGFLNWYGFRFMRKRG